MRDLRGQVAHAAHDHLQDGAPEMTYTILIQLCLQCARVGRAHRKARAADKKINRTAALTWPPEHARNPQGMHNLQADSSTILTQADGSGATV